VKEIYISRQEASEMTWPEFLKAMDVDFECEIQREETKNERFETVLLLTDEDLED
jgi:hypothetical protein